MSKFSFLVLLSLSLSPFASFAKESLEFLGDKNFHTSTEFGPYKVGGLSACAYDEKEKLLWAVSDDRSERGPARLYAFELTLNGNKMDLNLKRDLLLKDEKGEYFKKGTVDFEGLVLLPDGSFLISSEGNGDLKPKLPPEIMGFNSFGQRTGTWKLPDYILPEAKKQTKGVRNNLAFEGLTQIPKTENFALISEQALMQDGEETGNEVRSPSRLFITKKDKITKAYVYETSSYIDILGSSVLKGDSGVSDILALNAKEFLVLERSFFPTLLKTRIRLFKATITPEASEVFALPSLKGQKYLPVGKELVADLETYLPALDPKYPSMDNVEGLCFGPKLKDGRPTLILMSDNNFNVLQRTQFLFFALNGTK